MFKMRILYIHWDFVRAAAIKRNVLISNLEIEFIRENFGRH